MQSTQHEEFMYLVSIFMRHINLFINIAVISDMNHGLVTNIL